MSGEKTFALYRGDEFVDVGTARELASRHGIRPETVRWMSTPSYHRRAKGNRLAAYRIEEEE